jgi:hypothetical protein
MLESSKTPSTKCQWFASLEIGSGTIVTIFCAGINWATGPTFIKKKNRILTGFTQFTTS